MPHKTYWLEETDRVKVWLRRYRSACVAAEGKQTCEAKLVLHEDAPASDWGEYAPWKHGGETGGLCWHTFSEAIPDDSQLWQELRCSRCGVLFTDSDGNKQVWAEHLNAGHPSGKLWVIRDAPPGAMWNIGWMRDTEWAKGPDGICLAVRLPNGWDWWVDQQVSNCTRDQWKKWKDAEGREVRQWAGRTHYCWVRHGDPRSGNLHVDKQGNTCAAGAGSILVPGYHGFLHNGYLTDG